MKHITRVCRLRRYPRPAARLSIEGETHESTADGLLVVQVCRLGTISRKVPQAASPLIHRRDDGGPGLTRYANDLGLTLCVTAAPEYAGNGSWRRGRGRPGCREARKTGRGPVETH